MAINRAAGEPSHSAPTTDQSGKTYYAVSMDNDASDDATLFLADEIEADG
jgi:hypothetical protein